MGSDGSANERPDGPVRDPLADYVMSPEERAAPRVNSPYAESPKTSQDRIQAEMEAARRLLASAPYPTFDREPPTPTQPDPGVWPPPVYDQGAPAGFDPLLTITPYRSPSMMARVIVGFYGFHIFFCLISIAAAMMSVPFMAIAVVYLVGTIVGAVARLGLLFFWIYRAYSNLGAFHAGGLKSTPITAVGGWFIPILGIYLPWRAMNEIWRASDPEFRIDPMRPFAWQMSMSSPLVTFWWISSFLTYVIAAIRVSNNLTTTNSSGRSQIFWLTGLHSNI